MRPLRSALIEKRRQRRSVFSVKITFKDIITGSSSLPVCPYTMPRGNQCINIRADRANGDMPLLSTPRMIWDGNIVFGVSTIAEAFEDKQQRLWRSTYLPLLNACIARVKQCHLPSVQIMPDY